MVLSFSKAADAMMFSVGWQAVDMTTSGEAQWTLKCCSKEPPPSLPIRNDILCFWKSPFKRITIAERVRGHACVSTCVALQFLHNLLRLQIPDVDHVVLRTRHDPLQRRVSILFQCIFLCEEEKTSPVVLTLPPVTEKLANTQYFSFLWPVYVFKHCGVQGGHWWMQ